jgi:hypothetical protein
MEVGALEVGHDLMALLLYGVLLITKREERDMHLYGSGEVALTQGGEGDECRLLNGVIELAADDGPYPRLHGVEGYHQTDIIHIRAMGPREAVAVERDVPFVAETYECVV